MSTIEKFTSVQLNNLKPYIMANIESQLHHNKIGDACSKLYIAGGGGTGKSEYMEQVARELDCALAVQYMSTKALEQVTGMPKKDDGTSVFTQWSVPDIFNFSGSNMRYVPKNFDPNKTPVILFFDDSHMMNKEIQKYLFQLLTYRAIHSHQLPPNVVIMFAGNRSCDKAGHTQFYAPVVNRLYFMDVTNTVDAWTENYAIAHGVRADILGCLNHNKDIFIGEPMHSPWPSPRSWTLLSQELNFLEKAVGGQLKPEHMTVTAEGHIGQEATKQYMEFALLMAKWDGEQILTGKLQLGSDLTPIASYAVVSSTTAYLLNQLEKSGWNDTPEISKLCDAYRKMLHSIMAVAKSIIPLGLKRMVLSERLLPGNKLIFTKKMLADPELVNVVQSLLIAKK